MLKFVVLGVVAVILLVATIPVTTLYWTHRQIDELNPVLPSVSEVHRSSEMEGLPVSIEMVLTASQKVPVDMVLASLEGSNVTQNEHYEMSFPAFVVTWQDGKQFVIDAGLSKESAAVFGEPAEILGASPMQFYAGLGELIDVENVKGIGFTHLHNDHVDGVADLCPRNGKIKIVQTIEQYVMANYGTEASVEKLTGMPCALRLIIKDEFAVKGIAGFPGLNIVHVAGHTPGSQVFVINVRERYDVKTYILAGDLVNHFAAIEFNIAKPAWYSYLIVPENLLQLERARHWLKALAAEPNVEILVSHHRQQIEMILSGQGNLEGERP